jgi:hypothetical protein
VFLLLRDSAVGENDTPTQGNAGFMQGAVSDAGGSGKICDGIEGANWIQGEGQ